MLQRREVRRGRVSDGWILGNKVFDDGYWMGKYARESRTGDSWSTGSGWAAMNLVVTVLAYAREKNRRGGGLEFGYWDIARGSDEI